MLFIVFQQQVNTAWGVISVYCFWLVFLKETETRCLLRWNVEVLEDVFFVTWQQWKSLENEAVAAASATTVSY